jgi:hypothetical protein
MHERRRKRATPMVALTTSNIQLILKDVHLNVKKKQLQHPWHMGFADGC